MEGCSLSPPATSGRTRRIRQSGGSTWTPRPIPRSKGSGSGWARFARRDLEAQEMNLGGPPQGSAGIWQRSSHVDEADLTGADSGLSRMGEWTSEALELGFGGGWGGPPRSTPWASTAHGV